MRQRHRTSQQAFEIINGLCTHPHTLWEGASRRSTVVWLPYYWETSRASPARSNVRPTIPDSVQGSSSPHRSPRFGTWSDNHQTFSQSCDRAKAFYTDGPIRLLELMTWGLCT